MRRALCLSLVLILCVSLIGCGENNHDGEVKTPVESSELEGRNYEEVVKIFEEKGFTNIKTEAIHDLIFGWLTKDGEVEDVSIGGNVDYSSDKWVSANAEVIIRYHTFPENDEEESTPPTTVTPANTAAAPDDWTNLLEKHYEEVKKIFEDAGFTNITCMAHEIDFDENNVFEGSVVNIAVGENGEICTFAKGENWDKDIKIRIDYRVKPAVSETTAPVNAVVPLNECQVGNIVEFGSYPYLADGTKEPIQWLVLQVDGGKALLISRDILDAVQYHDKWEEITWENCALRKWLNDGFYNAAFSSSEKNQIVKVTNDNPDNNYSGFAPISGGYDTTDRVFVLCTEEIVEYFDIPVRGYHNPKASYDNLAAEWTEYAKSRQDPSVEHGYTSWFTRSPGSTRKMVAIVSAGGYAFNAFGIEGNQGVRPVIWVELD